MNKKILIGGVVGVITLVIIGVLFSLAGKDSRSLDASVHIEERFEDKIFYTTDISQDEAPYRNHCSQEEGIFQSCGSPCPPNTEGCVAVCAFTCDFTERDEDVSMNTSSRSIVRGSLGEAIEVLGITITPIDVLEDSRCPIDVICVQMGTVRVEVQIESGLGTAVETFEIGTEITTEAEAIRLIDVEPETSSASPTISSDEYEFTFEVRKRTL